MKNIDKYTYIFTLIYYTEDGPLSPNIFNTIFGPFLWKKWPTKPNYIYKKNGLVGHF